MWYISNKYGTIAQYLAILTLVQEVIYKSLTYNEALHFSKSAKWQKTMQEKYNTLIKNNIWDIVPIPDNQKVLKNK